MDLKKSLKLYKRKKMNIKTRAGAWVKLQFVFIIHILNIRITTKLVYKNQISFTFLVVHYIAVAQDTHMPMAH